MAATDSEPVIWLIYGVYLGEPILIAYPSREDAEQWFTELSSTSKTSLNIAKIAGVDWGNIDGSNSIWGLKPQT